MQENLHRGLFAEYLTELFGHASVLASAGASPGIKKSDKHVCFRSSGDFSFVTTPAQTIVPRRAQSSPPPSGEPLINMYAMVYIFGNQHAAAHTRRSALSCDTMFAHSRFAAFGTGQPAFCQSMIAFYILIHARNKKLLTMRALKITGPNVKHYARRHARCRH